MSFDVPRVAFFIYHSSFFIKTTLNDMKTYLVTGAAGFIGANYIKYEDLSRNRRRRIHRRQLH